MWNVIEALVQLLRATVAQTTSPLSNVKAVFWGDPVKIAVSDCPALIVHPVDTSYNRRGSRYDEKVHQVEIRLVYNAAQYMTSGAGVQDARKVYSLEQAIVAVEPTTAGNMSTVYNCVAGLVQANPVLTYLPKLGATAIVATADAKVRRVNYVFNSARGFPTFEIIVSIEARAVGDRATS